MPIIKPVFTATSTLTGDITVATATSVTLHLQDLKYL